MFTDEITIRVQGGHGGAGCLSFRREKYVPKGGPDGGDGGDGGSVILRVRKGTSSLYHLKGISEFGAEKGQQGMPSNSSGRMGKDHVIDVPVGTMVYDADTDMLLADLAEYGSSLIAAKGGRRGRGNKAFASAINQRPRQVELGLPGEQRNLRLVLKLIADVGLVGLPNAGKSTLISVLSHAKPKIASYPFTTLTPCLGIVDAGQFDSFTIADIPGLIEGASSGKGLGHRFLRHVERTRVLVHLLDCSLEAQVAPAEAFRIVRAELGSYSEKLARLPYLIAASKVESDEALRVCDELQTALGGKVLPISAVTHRGLDELVRRILALLAQDEDR